jgi:uncharacterized membrane protein YobD (UPF0266 family)
MQELWMVYKLGRMMQFVGLIVLPVAISGNVANQLTLVQCLTLSAIGIIIFYVGWLLQQSSGPRSP